MATLQQTPDSIAHIRQEVEEAIRPILANLSNGTPELEEEALRAIRKAVEGFGIKKGFPSFHHLNRDGFLITYGSAQGYEEEDRAIEGFALGYVEGLRRTRG